VGRGGFLLEEVVGRILDLASNNNGGFWNREEEGVVGPIDEGIWAGAASIARSKRHG